MPTASAMPDPDDTGRPGGAESAEDRTARLELEHEVRALLERQVRLLAEHNLTLRPAPEAALRVAPAAAALAEALAAEQPSLSELFDAFPLPAALYTPVRDARGEVVDLVRASFNPAAYEDSLRPDLTFDQAGLSVRQLTVAVPSLAATGVLDEWLEVVRTGRPAAERVVSWYLPHASGWLERRDDRIWAVPCAGMVLVVWQRANRPGMAREAQRLAKVGWGEWGLADNTLYLSPGLRDLLGFRKGDPAPSYERLLRRLSPSSARVLRDALERLLVHGEPVQGELTLLVEGSNRVLRFATEPMRPGPDAPVATLRMVAHDVSDLARGRRRLAAADAALQAERRRADAEAEIAERLRRAVLPASPAELASVGLDVAAAYRPSERWSGVGGDWFGTRLLPDGRAVMVVGDAQGHGLDAVALMAKLRNALAGLTFTGSRVEQLTGWLNELAYDDGMESTASAVIARYHPERRLLRWTCAGHPAPVLVREGRARLLEPFTGPPLGAVRAYAYPARETLLRRGDVVLLVSDGLVDRRDVDIDTQQARLLEAARLHAPDGPQATVTGVLDALLTPTAEDDATALAFAVL
ncbi:PP2C family protein-serine/threonine phosphatase [Streptacidiphilus monticola]|uniref:PP2C family protein-serine/threonine phosphatase n=1 Tax=Streptacidiphilus monticola TaxID=2161674 RepID=A0ABW1G2K6_9ACTN